MNNIPSPEWDNLLHMISVIVVDPQSHSSTMFREYNKLDNCS